MKRYEAKKNKPQAAKKEILEAAMGLLKNNSFDFLTIRSICKAAGISNGTFYHYFNSKEDLTTYVITEGYKKYKNERLSIVLAPQYRVVDIFIYIAYYLSSFGLGFLSNYMSVKNQSFNVDCIMQAEEHKEIVKYVLEQMQLAQDMGMIDSVYNVREIYDELNAIFYGSLFYWCLYNGHNGLIKSLNKFLITHFNLYLASEFKMEYMDKQIL